MEISEFIAVGENIHCTRSYKTDGKLVVATGDQHYIVYERDNERRMLPVPPEFTGNADWQAGKVKHCAVAIRQGVHGRDEDRAAGIDYLQSHAIRQQDFGASYIDINVDEFSTDVDERVQLMKWTVEIVQQSVSIPVSIDSSNADILESGLKACNTSGIRKPMVNSVSIERENTIDIAARHKAVVVASAAGKEGLPSTVDERMANLDVLIPMLAKAGFKNPDIHIDPLVLPISTDSNNGKGFLDTLRAIRKAYGNNIHIVSGLSNVSFGMPNRKLINQVFTLLAIEAGADGGIVDPVQINLDALRALDPESESFKLTRALLLGEDEFGMEYISACREGRI